jgi:hypothetical protein
MARKKLLINSVSTSILRADVGNYENSCRKNSWRGCARYELTSCYRRRNAARQRAEEWGTISGEFRERRGPKPRECHQANARATVKQRWRAEWHTGASDLRAGVQCYTQAGDRGLQGEDRSGSGPRASGRLTSGIAFV